MLSVTIPVKTIGPIKIVGITASEQPDNVYVPLATLETPLWPSTNRGASVTQHCAGVHCHLLDDRMTRSILLEGPDAKTISTTIMSLNKHILADVVSQTSRFCQLIDYHAHAVGNLLFLRLEATTGDASGHNMLTKAADAVMTWMLQAYPKLRYVSVSGNICTDKKVSAINGLLGRGKYLVADMLIPRSICKERLKTTPEAIVNLHIKKNLIGSIISGGVRTANAHFANLLYAIYLATGQDVANIVEGSQGITHAELRNQQDLYFSVTIPNIIVGTQGNGKHTVFAQQHLQQLGCLNHDAAPGENAKRLAMIVAATVYCGELSLLAAQTNPGELMRAHNTFERQITHQLI